jgi:SM-20-related protein
VPNATFFSRLGLFSASGFLDNEGCHDLRQEIRSAASTPSGVSEGADAYRLDLTVRRTLRAHVSAATLDRMRTRVTSLKPALETHFGLALGACQDPQFLIYRTGDFFAPHADAGDEPDEPDFIRRRAVSVVLFLSTESPTPGEAAHTGGSLVFYGLFDDDRARHRGLPLGAEEGVVVAFRATLLHGVNAVTGGERLSIVSWFERA